MPHELRHELAAELAERSQYWRDRMVEAADGDDELLLGLLAAHAAEIDKHMSRLRDLRDEAAERLRDQGVPMTRIARLAQVSDSYLAKRVFKLGGKRKYIRKGGALVAAGVLTLTSTYLTAAVASVRHEATGDVTYAAHVHRPVEHRRPAHERTHRRHRHPYGHLHRRRVT